MRTEWLKPNLELPQKFHSDRAQVNLISLGNNAEEDKFRDTSYSLDTTSLPDNLGRRLPQQLDCMCQQDILLGLKNREGIGSKEDKCILQRS
jgi:hypothetical protein